MPTSQPTPSMLSADDLLRLLQHFVADAGSASAAAKALGISAQYLSDVLHRRRAPGVKIVNALGYELVTGYVPITTKQVMRLMAKEQ